MSSVKTSLQAAQHQQLLMSQAQVNNNDANYEGRQTCSCAIHFCVFSARPFAWHAGVEALSVRDDTAATAVSSAQDENSEGTDTARKARSLQKKLKQIQQLKEKRDNNGSNTLTPEQLRKLESEQSILSELQQLEQS